MTIAALMPAHAIVRDPTSHQSYRCLCGVCAKGADALRVLAKHVTAQALSNPKQ